MEFGSVDFLEFWPPTVIDLIFQHLTGKEILSATLVSRSWNEFLTAHSITGWKNICVKPKAKEAFETLKNSSRCYQQLKAVNVNAPKLVEFIAKPRRKWKSIEIFRTQFENESQIEAILKASAKTLEHLTLNIITCPKLTDEYFPAGIHFPRLKHLGIFYHYMDQFPPWINGMFASFDQLESLQLANASDAHMKSLILQSKLKKLVLSGRFQDVNFFKDLSKNLPSRLEEFEFNDILSSSNDDENLSYFNSFFGSQSKSLLKFETDALLELEELHTAFSMSHLHTLCLKSFHYNHDVIRQHLEALREAEVPVATLKVLTVQSMDQNLLEMLAIHARNLEELHIKELHAIDVSNPAWFQKLKICRVFSINPILKEQILTKLDTVRSRLETLIIEQIEMMQTDIDLSEEMLEILDAM